MYLGVAFVPGFPAADVLSLAQLVEKSGFDGLYLPDQTFHRDPFTLLAAIGAQVGRIDLGLAVSNPYTRHPVQLARAAATLTDQTQGRFILGLGAGNRPDVLDRLGIEQERPAHRLETTIEVIRRLQHGESVTVDEPWLSLSDVHLDFAVADPTPLWIASKGPRVIEAAGRIADGLILEGLFTDAGLDYAREHIAAGKSGRSADAGDLVETCWQLVVVGDTGAANDPRWRAWTAHLIQSSSPMILERLDISTTLRDQVRSLLTATPERIGDVVDVDDVRKLVMVGDTELIATELTRMHHNDVRRAIALLMGNPQELAASISSLATLLPLAHSLE